MAQLHRAEGEPGALHLGVSNGDCSPLFHPPFSPLLCQAAPFFLFRKISGHPELLVTLVTVDLSHLSPEIPRPLNQSNGNHSKLTFIKG